MFCAFLNNWTVRLRLNFLSLISSILGSELWSLDDPGIEVFCVAWRKGLRRLCVCLPQLIPIYCHYCLALCRFLLKTQSGQSLGTDLFHGPKVTDKGGRSSAAIPDVEVRPEIETRQKPEMDNPAEIEFSVSITCEGDLGATGPITAKNRQK